MSNIEKKLSVLEIYQKIGYLDYGQKKWSSDDRLKVGNMLHDDFYLATHGIQAINYEKERVDCFGLKLESDKMLEAKERFARAMKSIPLEFKGIVFRVACEDKRIAEPQRLTRWNRKIFLVTQAQLLSLGLDRLIKYYLKKNKRIKNYAQNIFR